MATLWITCKKSTETNKSTDNIKFWLIVSRETITNRFVKSIWKL